MDDAIGAGANVAAQEDVLAQNIQDSSTMAIIYNIVTFGCEMAMIFGGVVPYIPQYLAIKKSKTTKGFSLYVCLALIVANILRILFWFGRHYELPLLIQSVLMTFAMLALIRICVQVNEKDHQMVGYSTKERVFSDFNFEYFWQWSDFQSYLECTLVFVSFGSLLMYLCIRVDPFVEAVGFAAVFTEAMLGTPQFYRNYCNKSTYGMSLQMVLMWTCGDIFKTTYFFVRKTPLQFVVCGCLQVMVDFAILSQVWMYRENTTKRRKSEGNHLNS